MTKTTLSNMDLGTATVEDKDVVGNAYGVLDTDIYPFFINEAFIETAASGAVGIHLTLKEKKDGSGKVLEKTIYIQSGDEKGNKSYYEDKATKKQIPLPGYTLMNSLCQILAGKDLKEMNTSPMAAEIYDSEQGKRVTSQVEMLKALIGKGVYVAVMKETVWKYAKNDAGKSFKTGETQEANDIVKFFRAKDKKSVTEIDANTDQPAAFFDTWLTNWKGKVRDRTGGKGKVVAPAGASDTTGAESIFDGDD